MHKKRKDKTTLQFKVLSPRCNDWRPESRRRERSASITFDLEEERRNCGFNTRELTEWLDGGRERTRERKRLEQIFLDGESKV